MSKQRAEPDPEPAQAPHRSGLRFTSTPIFIGWLLLACGQHSSTDGSGGNANAAHAGAAGGDGATDSTGSSGTSAGGASTDGGGSSVAGGANTGAAAGTNSAGAAGGAGMASAGGAAGGASGSSGTAGGVGNGGAAGLAGAAGQATANGGGAGELSATPWVGTWSASPQLTESANLPPAPGLSNRTLRQIFYVSIGGKRVRVHFSNEYGQSSVTLSAAHLALSKSGHTIDLASDHALTFSGSPSVTIAAGATTISDPFDFTLPAQTKVALSLAFGATPVAVTGHPGSRTTSYIATGNAVAAESLTAPVTAEHWYYATGIDVVAEAGEAAVV
ncbi:MAG: hypothetical protein ABI548_05050, partial [Polyangiaceae bacterium]